MTGAELAAARLALGLYQEELGRMLGFSGRQIKATVYRLETGERPVRDVHRRLVEAYLAGYRPPDWPGRS